jgi:hypothetical protein
MNPVDAEAFFQANLRARARVSGPFIFRPEGVLLRAPEYERRTNFVVAYEIDIPTYTAGPRMSPLELEDPFGPAPKGYTRAGNAIHYCLLRPEYILERPAVYGGVINIITKDKHFLFGGSFWRPQDITSIRELLEANRAA